MLTFDATSREVCAVKRQPTATRRSRPWCSLNDPQYRRGRAGLAQRAMREGGSTFADRITLVVRLLTGRRPGERELTTLEALYREQYDEFRSGRPTPRSFSPSATSPRSGVDPAELAAMHGRWPRRSSIMTRPS